MYHKSYKKKFDNIFIFILLYYYINIIMIKHNLHRFKPIITTNSGSIIKTSTNCVSKVFYNKTNYKNELYILSKLQHPNIIKIKKHYEDEYKKGVIEFKYYEDGDLLSFINKHTRTKNTNVSNKQRLHIFNTIAHTLLYCHQNNIVHGDIKPDNFLLEHHTPVMIDFGLSIYNKDFYNPLEKNMVFRLGKQGSDGYIAPEVQDNYIGPCSDVYSLGIVLYQLFLNEYPHFNNDVLELNFNEKNKCFPYKVCNLLHEMLHVDYKQRPTLEEIIMEYDIENI